MQKNLEKETVHTWCPNCKTDIDSVWVCKLESTPVLRYAYFCTVCQKKLGIFSRKGITSEEISRSLAEA